MVVRRATALFDFSAQQAKKVKFYFIIGVRVLSGFLKQQARRH